MSSLRKRGWLLASMYPKGSIGSPFAFRKTVPRSTVSTVAIPARPWETCWAFAARTVAESSASATSASILPRYGSSQSEATGSRFLARRENSRCFMPLRNDAPAGPNAPVSIPIEAYPVADT